MLLSPWTWVTTDYQGLALSVTITFANLTGTILTMTAHKDAGCMYGRVYFGLGADGTPDTATAQIAIPQGDSIIAVAVLGGFGFAAIGQALASQVTAGP